MNCHVTLPKGSCLQRYHALVARSVIKYCVARSHAKNSFATHSPQSRRGRVREGSSWQRRGTVKRYRNGFTLMVTAAVVSLGRTESRSRSATAWRSRADSPNGGFALLAQKIWEEDTNAKGGLLGRPVKLIHYDDQTNPATGPTCSRSEIPKAIISQLTLHRSFCASCHRRR